MTGDDWHGWSPLHRLLTTPENGDIPLSVAKSPVDACTSCRDLRRSIDETGRGLAFALTVPFGEDHPIDIAGRVGFYEIVTARTGS